MASFDVTSLFTNIPVDETIEIITNRLFSNCCRFHGLTRSDFTKLLGLSVKNCHFVFNGRLYHQVDGVAMGSPLGPLFANIFMSFHEKDWLHNCPSSFKPLLYRRYVDDYFLLFRRSEHVQLFLTYLIASTPTSFASLVRLDVMVSSHFSTLTYSALMENVLLLFTVNLRLLVFLPTSIASFHLHTNAA